MTDTALHAFPLRVIQLDLARQMETPGFIRDFIRFAAGNGFNALALYLEGRIRTTSFPYPSAEESYTPGTLREIVAYAATFDMEVIPVVSTLGHAELFLQYAALLPLAETRPPFVGRFGAGEPNAFCPSLLGTYEFLGRYLEEIADLFPSRYFHVGGDETWDLGRCDLCRQQASQADLYRTHLMAIHEMVTGKLGKRIIIWDDMLIDYPQVLQDLPRDIILACWQYGPRVDPPRGHFLHRETVDLLQRYDQLGFDYLICPADYTILNAESFTAYAVRHTPLGGWLTIWEKHDLTPLQSYPLIAAVGRLWAAPVDGVPEAPLAEVAGELFGINEPIFLQAVRSLYEGGWYKERYSTPAIFLTTGRMDGSRQRRALVDLLLPVLAGYRDLITGPYRLVFEELLLSLESEQVSLRLRELLPRLFKHLYPGDQAALPALIHSVETLHQRRRALHAEVRPGLSLNRLDSLYTSYLAQLRDLSQMVATSGYLEVHFCLADLYNAQTTRISLRALGTSESAELAQEIFKPSGSLDAYYSRIFPIAKNMEPQEIIVETWGYGGQGFSWFEARTAHGVYTPCSVIVDQGILTHPDWLLRPDDKAAFAGEPDAHLSFFDDDTACAIHRFRIRLQRGNPS